MSETPIYDELMGKLERSRQVAFGQDVLNNFLDLITDETFDLSEEDLAQIPKIIGAAVKNVGGSFVRGLPDIRDSLNSEVEFRAYISGVLSVFATLQDLGPPRQVS